MGRALGTGKVPFPAKPGYAAHFRIFCLATAGHERENQELVTDALLDKWLPKNRDVDAYFLGPKSFMQAVKKHLKALGVPESQSRYEFFGPAAALE